MSARSIRPVAAPLDAELRAVPSKSVTHRALVAAALAEGTSTIADPLDADDGRATVRGLRAMGVEIDASGNPWSVRGSAGLPDGGGRADLGESGTSMRLLAAVAALGASPTVIDGAPRLRERPMAPLVEALRRLGADVRTAASGGLPLAAGGGRPRGGAVAVAGTTSSQFASALLLIGPCLSGGLDLMLLPPAVSLPYIDVTVEVMRAFGATVLRPDPLRFRVEEGAYRGRAFRVEGDHSSASYFLAAPAIAGGRVRVVGLDPSSAQPDARFARILADLGFAVRSGDDWIEVRGGRPIPGFELDMGDAPDLVPTLAALALRAEGPSAIRGIGHLRAKESDRIAVLAENLRRLGRAAASVEDRLEVGMPTGAASGEPVRTAGDHRIAMAFAVVGLATPGVSIDDPACVAKSNPAFWDAFASLERG